MSAFPFRLIRANRIRIVRTGMKLETYVHPSRICSNIEVTARFIAVAGTCIISSETITAM